MNVAHPRPVARLTRRTLLMRAGAATFVAAGWAPAARASTPARRAGDEAFIEATVVDLQRQMASGRLTSRALTQAYLERIARLNPLLHAVIETNPQAIASAARADSERRAGHLRGALHGVPVLLKDNIDTADAMQTTAGSLALERASVAGDAPLVARLRAAGAVILGKANLSEWANFRGYTPLDATESFFLNGWSARGGFTRNPYQLGWDPCGSSSGCGVASAANLCAVAVGTETDGSITCPASANMVVGLKPTLGLISQSGIVPIAHSQDTAGPMGRTVTDVAVLLGALQSPFGSVAGAPLPADYTTFLRRGALAGARIGVDPNLFFNYTDPAQAEVAWQAVRQMAALGATIVDDVDVNDPLTFYDDEFTVLLAEFKIDIEAYLATRSRTSMRTLADLIAFNNARCRRELRYYGQELFELAQTFSGDPNDSAYVEARRRCLHLARDTGLAPAFTARALDALVIPTLGWSSSHAAVAGYPHLSMPVGFDSAARPVGLSLVGNFLAEPRLLALAFDLEQTMLARRQPEFTGTPYPWPDAQLCAAQPGPPRHAPPRRGHEPRPSRHRRARG